jgi:hypothetical protein
VVSDVQSDIEFETEIESDTQPQPAESDYVDKKPTWADATGPLVPPQPEPVIPAKPSWWTNPWQRLEQEALPESPASIPRVVCPLQFREQVFSDVRAIDMYGSENRIDPDTGVKIECAEGNDLSHGVIGVV